MIPLSAPARQAEDKQFLDDYAIVLMQIRHRSLGSTRVLLSSDPTEMLDIEPYTLGTKSTWLSPTPGLTRDFKFIMMGVDLPDDTNDSLHQGSLVIQQVENTMPVYLVQSYFVGTADLAVVMRSTPNLVERQFLNLKIVSAEGDGANIAFTFSRRNILDEPCPSIRMTRQRTPGLHR